jgi:hypothetical protein
MTQSSARGAAAAVSSRAAAKNLYSGIFIAERIQKAGAGQEVPALPA